MLQYASKQNVYNNVKKDLNFFLLLQEKEV